LDGNIYDRKRDGLGVGENRARAAAETHGVETDAKREGKTAKDPSVNAPRKTHLPMESRMREICTSGLTRGVLA